MRRICVFFAFCFCFLFLFSSCSQTKTNREGQCPLPFSAVIEGTRGELAFRAEIAASNTERTIRYTAPEALAGLTVTETNGKISIGQADFSAENVSDAAGFLAPLDLLLSPAELTTVEEENGEQTLTYADGTKLIFGKDGIPRAVMGTEIFYTISDFQKTQSGRINP